MTNFAGEEYLITHIALGFKGEVLGEDDLESVKVTVYDSDDELSADVNDESLTWNPDAVWGPIKIEGRPGTVSGVGWWEYLWDTSAVADGTYRAKVILTGATGGKNIEYLRIRLKKDPLPVA